MDCVFVDFTLCQSLQKRCCLEGVQRQIELLHTRTSQSSDGSFTNESALRPSTCRWTLGADSHIKRVKYIYKNILKIKIWIIKRFKWIELTNSKNKQRNQIYRPKCSTHSFRLSAQTNSLTCCSCQSDTQCPPMNQRCVRAEPTRSQSHI